MKKIILITFLSVLLGACARNNKHSVSYTISPGEVDGQPLLHVRMAFQADEDGETILAFQDKAWGEDSLHNALHEMKLLSGEGEIIQERDSGRIVIKHPKNNKDIGISVYLKTG